MGKKDVQVHRKNVLLSQRNEYESVGEANRVKSAS